MADKTINLTPYHCESGTEGGGFCLTFFCNTEGGNTVRVKLHMEFWWVKFIARDLWKIIRARRAEADEAEKALTNAT